MKKKIMTLALSAVMAVSLAACGAGGNSDSSSSGSTSASGSSAVSDVSSASAASDASTASSGEEKPETITVKSLNANKEEDRVVGSAGTSLDYLQDYVTDENIENLGTIKEADMEAVMACEPDVIFIGGRLSSSYDTLSEIAPVAYLSTDTEIGVVESVRKNASTIAAMFGLEDQVDELMADFDERIETLAAFAEGKTAIVGMCTSGSFNVLGNDGRCSMIGREIGFENVGVDANADTSTHGNEASFEYVVEKNPDYIFVMDRDAAIGTDGAQLAQDIMENELVQGTDAYKNGQLVYLEHPAVWYTAEGGVQALDLMLQDLENTLLA